MAFSPGRSSTVRRDRHLRLGLDLIAITGLVLVGQYSHGMSPVSAPIDAARAVVPFLVAWLVVSSVGGLYENDSPQRSIKYLGWLAICWLAAANLGFLLRGSPFLPGGVPWEFTAVFTGLGLCFLLGIHVGYELYRSVVATEG
ncbi:DUF3054 domain-containing protein [Halovivax gelatinilyticus]|uniref:DUF3054 domain-containing protein n=1 Tax=Halovivax gelatinilyticus TaxID=2961597 RepID=UPI002115350B|nr:DUF3054 domain-containing protein [Halovivax gelatinilyticus]